MMECLKTRGRGVDRCSSVRIAEEAGMLEVIGVVRIGVFRYDKNEVIPKI